MSAAARLPADEIVTDAAITLTEAAFLLRVFRTMFDEDGDPVLTAHDVRQQTGLILSKLKSTTSAIIEVRLDDEHQVERQSLSGVLAEIYRHYDIVCVLHHAMHGDRFPHGDGVTQSPARGAMDVVSKRIHDLQKELSNIASKLRQPVRGKSKTRRSAK